jgi:hypothetical protein
METAGYSRKYIARVRGEIKRILVKANTKDWLGYGDVYRDYAEQSVSQYYLKTKRVILGLIERFDIYGEYPNRQYQRYQLIQRGKYHLLADEFKKVIDYYCTIEKERGFNNYRLKPVDWITTESRDRG